MGCQPPFPNGRDAEWCGCTCKCLCPKNCYTSLTEVWACEYQASFAPNYSNVEIYEPNQTNLHSTEQPEYQLGDFPKFNKPIVAREFVFRVDEDGNFIEQEQNEYTEDEIHMLTVCSVPVSGGTVSATWTTDGCCFLESGEICGTGTVTGVISGSVGDCGTASISGMNLNVSSTDPCCVCVQVSRTAIPYPDPCPDSPLVARRTMRQGLKRVHLNTK
jgi:hypothetical protein